MENNNSDLGLSLEDFKGMQITKAFQTEDIEKAKTLDPKGKWVTINGRHVHLNAKGDVDAGKVYGKDNKDSKDETSHKITKPKIGTEKKTEGSDVPEMRKKLKDLQHTAHMRPTTENRKAASDYEGKVKEAASTARKNKAEGKSSKLVSTGVDYVDNALKTHNSSSDTPAIAKMELNKVKEKLTKRLEKLSSGMAANPKQRMEKEKLGKALGEVKSHLSKLEGRGDIQKSELDGIFNLLDGDLILNI